MFKFVRKVYFFKIKNISIMKTKLFYEQPRIRVVNVRTEVLTVSFSNSGYGDEKDENWDN